MFIALTTYLQDRAMTKISQNQDALFVGVDVSKATLEVALDDRQRTEQFANDEAGIAALLTRLRDLPVARMLSHFARTLSASERREQLLLRLPSVEQQELAVLVVRRAQVVQARVAERNRLSLAHRLQTKSINTIIKALDKEIKALDADIDRRLDKHFKDKLDLLKALRILYAACCCATVSRRNAASSSTSRSCAACMLRARTCP